MGTNRSYFCALTVLLTLAFSYQSANAAVEFELLDHPDGNAAADGIYGLRLDNGSVQTFSFSPGVTLSFDPLSPQTAKISGSIKHLQSPTGQVWSIEATLSTVFVGNADGTDWRSNVTPPPRLYDGIIEDLQTNGASSFGVGADQLKRGTPAPSTPTDRLGFEIVDVTLTLDPLLTPDFSLPNNSADPNIINIDEFPNDDASNDYVPFVITKGHRLDALTDELVGIGWLEPAEDAGRGYTQDFLFVVGPPMPGPSDAPVPEPMSLLVWAMLGLCGYTSSRRSGSSRGGV